MSRFRDKRRIRLFGHPKEPSLTRIIIGIVAATALVLGGARGYGWYRARYGGEGAKETAKADLDQARDFIAQGNDVEARKRLEPIAARVRDDAITPDTLMLLADVEQRAGNHPKALELLGRAKDEFPDSPLQPRVALAYARLLEETDRADEAASVYEQVRAETPPHLRAAALTGLGRQAERETDLVAARDLYRQAVRDAEWNGDAWNEAVDALGRVNVALIFSIEPIPDSKVYTVEQGDTLNGIGVKLNTTQGLLTRANGIDDPAALWPGQQMKYTPKDFRVVIERSTCRLFLLDKEGLFKRYYAGLGKPGSETTLGTYKVGNKEKDPVWHKRGEGPIPSDDPRNELGTRWIPLVPVEEGLPTDLGIHGTTKPETVGTYVSMGCARLLREDVEELYDLIVRSTPVQIVEVFTPDQVL